LALRGIEFVLRDLQPFPLKHETRCLDIGTGSGILALAALKLGAARALGLDIDPCAISECRQNARLNGLSHRLKVEDVSLDLLTEAFDLALANLRLPTLCRIQPQLRKRLQQPGALVFSGFKVTEIRELSACYQAGGFQLVWQASEKDWSAAVFTEGVRNVYDRVSHD
jgi:ribosomal protein L11 methyltransferase